MDSAMAGIQGGTIATRWPATLPRPARSPGQTSRAWASIAAGRASFPVAANRGRAGCERGGVDPRRALHPVSSPHGSFATGVSAR